MNRPTDQLVRIYRKINLYKRNDKYRLNIDFHCEMSHHKTVLDKLIKLSRVSFGHAQIIRRVFVLLVLYLNVFVIRWVRDGLRVNNILTFIFE